MQRYFHFALAASFMFCVTNPSHAQVFRNNPSANQPASYVTVYEDCDYRGAGRNLPAGDYQDMRAIQLRNDTISSLRIPDGFAVSVHQDERFGGFSTSFNQDVKCLDSGWNDHISSLKVDLNDSRTEDTGGYYTQANVDGTTVSRVEFAETLLEKSGDKRWRLGGRAGQSTEFRELSSNENAVYLESLRDGQRMRVDFFTNDVTILARNGQQASYPLSRALRVDETYRAPVPTVAAKPPPAQSPTNIVRGRCFNYTATATGGDAGVRFKVGDGVFHRFAAKGHSGRLCHQGEVVMEINKNAVGTAVTVNIQGNKYTFAANEAHDAYRNTWYRKNMTLRVVP